MAERSTDEAAIEAELKELVARVNRGIDWSANVGCFGWIAIIGLSAAGGGIIGAIVGAVVGVLVSFGLAATYDERLIKRTARRFHERWPVSSPQRATAITILDELESKGSGLEKVRAKIREGDGVTRRRAEAPITAENVLNAVPPPVHHPPASVIPIQPLGEAREKKNGVARAAPQVVPLEPFDPDPEKK